jgi:hypothetical protein
MGACRRSISAVRKNQKIFRTFFRAATTDGQEADGSPLQRSKEIIMFKRTLVSGLIATTVVASMLAGTVQPSAAHSHHFHNGLGIGIAAGVGGFLLGTALAQPRTVYVEEDGGSWHVRRCFDRYASYDPASDSYIGYDGYPHYCRL